MKPRSCAMRAKLGVFDFTERKLHLPSCCPISSEQISLSHDSGFGKTSTTFVLFLISLFRRSTQFDVLILRHWLFRRTLSHESGAREPPFRKMRSHRSGRTEPPCQLPIFRTGLKHTKSPSSHQPILQWSEVVQGVVRSFVVVVIRPLFGNFPYII